MQSWVCRRRRPQGCVSVHRRETKAPGRRVFDIKNSLFYCFLLKYVSIQWEHDQMPRSLASDLVLYWLLWLHKASRDGSFEDLLVR